ncbi:hypothetical protein Tco_0324797 [Tanacetum coccineum]
MKLFQDMQLIQKLRNDQKCMKKVVEDMSGSYEHKSNQGNIVTNSRMTPSWKDIVSLTILVKLASYTKFIQQGPYIPTTVIIPAKEATDNSPVVPECTAVKIILNMSPENKEHYQSENEAIHLLLTRIGDEIYSTVDACKTAHDMWIAIKRLQQSESINIQDVKTNLFWEFRKFTSHDGESMESYYSRFYKMMNEMIRNNLTVATMQVNEVKKICAERIAKNANLLALVVTAQQYPDPYYQAPKSHKSYAPPSKQSSLTKSNASTKFKGKEIAKPITPLSESASEEDSDPEQAQRDKDMQNNLALIAKYFKKIYKPTNNNLRTSSNSRNKNMDTSPRKPKRVKDYMYHKEKMLLCKQVEKGVLLQVEQANWLEDMDDEIDEQELKAHYGFMEKIQEVLPPESNLTIEPLEHVQYDVDSNGIPDSPYMCDNDIQTDQNAKDERAALANLITELENYMAFNDRTVDYNKLERKLNETLGLLAQKRLISKKLFLIFHFRAPTALDMEVLIKTCLMPLAIKTQNDSFAFVHELKQEMHADLKYVESLEKEIDKLESNKSEFSNMYDILLQECVSNDVMCSYLHSLSDLDAHAELQCLYVHKVKECECLAQKLSKQTETVSKEVYNELLRSFAKLEKHSISLELALQQCQEQMKNDTVCKEKASNVFLKEREQYFEIQDLKAQLQDKDIAISELKKLIEKNKGKGVDTNFEK